MIRCYLREDQAGQACIGPSCMCWRYEFSEAGEKQDGDNCLTTVQVGLAGSSHYGSRCRMSS